MATMMLLLSAMIGQCPPGGPCPVPMRPPAQVLIPVPVAVPQPVHHRVDDSGKLWHHADPDHLNRWVDYRNRQLRTAAPATGPGPVQPTPASPPDSAPRAPARVPGPKAENFGLRLEEISHEPRGQLETNDKDFGLRVMEETPDVAPPAPEAGATPAWSYLAMAVAILVLLFRRLTR